MIEEKEQNPAQAHEVRTDLALEMKERFTQDNVEVRGVVLDESFKADDKIRISTVVIRDEHGAEVMKKPIGTYITIEAVELLTGSGEERDMVSREIAGSLRQLLAGKKVGRVLVAGLGNREVTPDSLGPQVTDQLFVTRHLVIEYGSGFLQKQLHNPSLKEVELSAVAPGVMAQTGMEALEFLKGIVQKIKPELVLVIDALAARSVERLNTTVQLTDSGICPGAGIGNNRKAINRESLGCPVVAIGVPTVVDAVTIVMDSMEQLLKGQGYHDEEIRLFLANVESLRSVNTMFVTPKSIDEEIRAMGTVLANAINHCFFGLLGGEEGEGDSTNQTISQGEAHRGTR